MSTWLSRLMHKRRVAQLGHGSFVAETEFHRNEELRPERLGPSADDVDEADQTHVDPWRPRRTLGPMPKD
jgi:hypothetical protein